MKKILLSLMLLSISIISFSKTFIASPYPCLSTIDVQNLGNNQICGDIAGYKKTGTLTIGFSAPVPASLVSGPQITAIREIINGVVDPNILDVKFSFVSFTSNRLSATYCFYTPDGKNFLKNGAHGLYKVDIIYAGYDAQTCDVEQAPPITLPVHFSSFSASRTSASRVSISWTTASEQNNRGFNVQKNVNGEWKTIAFVFSQTDNGNSVSALTYSYNDPNSDKGVSQYRIQQVDLDGKFAYSDIRAIRGEAAEGKVIAYPNPSVDGKVNVVFEDNTAVRDVQVNDMQGKIIRSYKGITNNILVIERLTSGFYTIKVTNHNTAASSVQKVIIK